MISLIGAPGLGKKKKLHDLFLTVECLKKWSGCQNKAISGLLGLREQP